MTLQKIIKTRAIFLVLSDLPVSLTFFKFYSLILSLVVISTFLKALTLSRLNFSMLYFPTRVEFVFHRLGTFTTNEPLVSLVVIRKK